MGVYISNLRLPSEYQEVEWIQSSGTQYIDTGYTPKTTSEFEVKFQNVSAINTYRTILGTRQDSGNNSFWIGWQNGKSYSQFSPTNSEISSSNGWFNTGVDYTLEFKNKNLVNNGTTVVSSINFTQNANYTLYLFSGHAYNKTNPFEPSATKIYYCKLREGGTLVRDFIPCYRKSDNVIGLYDLINSVFYTNSGSGTFSKGNDVTMLELKNAYIGEAVNISSDLRGATLAGLQAQGWTDITSVSGYNLNSSGLSNTAVSGNNVLLYKYVPNLSSNNIITLHTTGYAQRNKSSETYRYNSIIMIGLFNSTDASDNGVYASSLAGDYSACGSTQDTKTGINYRESNKALTILGTAGTGNQAGSVDMTTRINLNTGLVEYTLTSPQTHTTSATLNSTQLSLARSLKYIGVVAQPKDSSNTTTIYTVELTIE